MAESSKSISLLDRSIEALKLESQVRKLYEAYKSLKEIDPKTEPFIVINNLTKLLRKSAGFYDSTLLAEIRDLYRTYKNKKLTSMDQNSDPNVVVQRLGGILSINPSSTSSSILDDLMKKTNVPSISIKVEKIDKNATKLKKEESKSTGKNFGGSMEGQVSPVVSTVNNNKHQGLEPTASSSRPGSSPSTSATPPLASPCSTYSLSSSSQPLSPPPGPSAPFSTSSSSANRKNSLGNLLKLRRETLKKARKISTPDEAAPPKKIVKTKRKSPKLTLSMDLDVNQNETLPLEVISKRQNFGFSDDGPVANCPVALNFWWGQDNSNKTKYFIRLHKMGSQKLAVTKRVGLHHHETDLFTLSQLKEQVLGGASTTVIHSQPVIIWLDIRDLAYLQSTETMEVLSAFEVTHLSIGGKLSRDDLNVNEMELLQFINQRLPRLQYLALNDEQIFHEPDDEGSESDQSQNLDQDQPAPATSSSNLVFGPFNQLKTLRFVNITFQLSEKFVHRILEKSATPNLATIYCLPLKYVRLIEETKRFSLLKSIDFSSSHYNNIPKDFYQDANQMMLQSASLRELEELTAPIYMRLSNDQVKVAKNVDVEYQIRELLASQQHQQTLKKLILELVPRHLRFNLSRRDKVEILQFNLWLLPLNFHPMYPDGTNLSEIFPNVAKVILNFSRDWDNINELKYAKKDPLTIFRDSLPVDWNSFKKVKSLQLMDSIPVPCLEEIGTLFKNVKSLSLKGQLPKLLEILPKIYNEWPKLEELKVEIQLKIEAGSEQQQLLISQALTTALDQVSVDPIIKMKELKKVKVIFSGQGWSSTGIRESPCLSSLNLILNKVLTRDCQLSTGFDESCMMEDKAYIVSILGSIQLDHLSDAG